MYVKRNINKNLHVRKEPEPHTDYDTWCKRFYELMRCDIHAPITIVKHCVSNNKRFHMYPVEDEIYKSVSATINTDVTVFTAAEETGLIAEGVRGVFRAAFHSCDSWRKHALIVKNILARSDLCKHVPNVDRYYAEIYLSTGEMLYHNEKMWKRFKQASEKRRKSRNSTNLLEIMDI